MCGVEGEKFSGCNVGNDASVRHVVRCAQNIARHGFLRKFLTMEDAELDIKSSL